jgi:hypothetical protein
MLKDGVLTAGSYHLTTAPAGYREFNYRAADRTIRPDHDAVEPPLYRRDYFIFRLRGVEADTILEIRARRRWEDDGSLEPGDWREHDLEVETMTFGDETRHWAYLLQFQRGGVGGKGILVPLRR